MPTFYVSKVSKLIDQKDAVSIMYLDFRKDVIKLLIIPFWIILKEWAW